MSGSNACLFNKLNLPLSVTIRMPTDVLRIHLKRLAAHIAAFFPVPRLLIERVENLENKIAIQVKDNSILLDKLKLIQVNQEERLVAGKEKNEEPSGVEIKTAENLDVPNLADESSLELTNSKPIIPVLLFSCNRWVPE